MCRQISIDMDDEVGQDFIHHSHREFQWLIERATQHGCLDWPRHAAKSEIEIIAFVEDIRMPHADGTVRMLDSCEEYDRLSMTVLEHGKRVFSDPADPADFLPPYLRRYKTSSECDKFVRESLGGQVQHPEWAFASAGWRFPVRRRTIHPDGEVAFFYILVFCERQRPEEALNEAEEPEANILSRVSKRKLVDVGTEAPYLSNLLSSLRLGLLVKWIELLDGMNESEMVL
jgi:hypothetical protein